MRLPIRVTPIRIAVLAVLCAIGVQAVPPGTDEEISARLEPFGTVCRAGDDCGAATASAGGGGTLSGQEVYDQFCFACHATGVGGAPLLGDADAWAARIDKGMDEMVNTTINGLNAMPPKGTCMNCSDAELGDAVTYMLDQL